MKCKLSLLSLYFYTQKKNNKRLSVYGSRGTTLQTEKEKLFYQKILGKKNWTYLPNNIDKTYEYIDKAKLTICMDSTLGYESLARGNKVILFCLRGKIYKSFNFGWPVNFKHNGFFWSNKLSNKLFNTIVERVSRVSKKKWDSIVKKNTKSVITYDKNNYIFQSLIKDYLKV